MYRKRQYFLELLQNQRSRIPDGMHLGEEPLLQLLDESRGFLVYSVM